MFLLPKSVRLAIVLLAALPGPARADSSSPPPCGGRVNEAAIASSLRTSLPPGTQVGNPIFIRVVKRPQADFDLNSSIAETRTPHSLMDTYTYKYHPDKYLNSADLSQFDSGKGHPGGRPQMNRYSTFVASTEVWIRSSAGKFVLYKTYPVAVYSGTLGPKLNQGDDQTPEGFYNITESQLNPQSTYRAAMDLGYPNAYDQAHGRHGSLVEMHGCMESAGCLAMGKGIDEIYTLVHAALKNGQEQVPIHVFPFPLTDANLAKIPAGPLKNFWKELQPGYLAFQNGLPPTVTSEDGKYVVSDNFPGNPNKCLNLDDLSPVACPLK